MRLKFAIRSLRRNRLNSSVILISLAIGLACINTITLFLNRELNTDSFHADEDRIYGLQCDDPWTNGGKMNHCRAGSAEYMVNNFSQVEDYCRINHASPKKIVVNKVEYFNNPVCIKASGNFFSFFSYNLITNNEETVLETKNNIVISDQLAKKFFGSNDVVGQIITFSYANGNEDLVVSGVFKRPTENTQLNFEMVRLGDESDSRCYIKLKEDAHPEEVEQLFVEHKNQIPVIHGGEIGQYYLSSLKESYFDTTRRAGMELSRDKADLWIAAIIGLLILTIALFNYLGLLYNNLIEKQKQYAIRKINGGTKQSFIFSFMTETLVVLLISLFFSFVLMLWILPFFSKLTNARILMSDIFHPQQLVIYLSTFLLLVLVTFFFLLLNVKQKISLTVLKNTTTQAGTKFQIPAINIFQLTATLVLIVSSIIILKQINYTSNKPIGLNKDIIEVKIPGAYAQIAPAFKEELLRNSSVKSISVTGASPLLEHFLLLLNYNDGKDLKNYTVAGFSGDENYLSTIGAELIKGNNFSENPAANNDKVIVNESLYNKFQDTELLGRELPGNEDQIVIGVVKDFHYSSLKSVVEPALISYSENGNHLMVEPVAMQSDRAREVIAATWAKLIPDFPLELETIGERYEWLNRENRNYIQLIGACCFISILLSMMGLFAISFQTSKKRTKEIGIRKVNGAKVSEILAMLNKDFVKWVVISFAVATPLAYYAMNKWLENFAYKTTLSWWIFVLAGVLALGIALFTVSWQSWRAATRNPVEALRYE